MAVHYVKFVLDERTERALKDGADVVVGVEHPGYRAETRLSPATLESLRRDFM
jgi:hypothetical protein